MSSRLIPMLEQRFNCIFSYLFQGGQQFVFSLNSRFWVSIHVLDILKNLNVMPVDPNAWTKVQFDFQLFILSWEMIFVFSLHSEFWLLIYVSDILENLNFILVDPNAWTKVQFYFQLFIKGWATIFVFSPNPEFWVLIDALDMLKSLNVILVDPCLNKGPILYSIIYLSWATIFL